MYELIEHKKLDSPGASITFSNIPQNGTDLLLIFSLRADSADGNTTLSFNGSTANFSVRTLFGSGSGVGSDTSVRLIAGQNPSNHTANTFASAQLYIPNYAGSTNKSFSFDGVQENNATGSYQNILAGLWSQTAPITSITLTNGSGNFVSGSSATLYKINRTSAIGRSPQAVGGYINYANGYWYHTFTGSGSFSPFNDLQIEYLVVAGGGGGGSGGGGAGGYLTGSSSVTATTYAITVGAGGSGSTGNSSSGIGTDGTNGSSSSAFSVTATGGGGGGKWGAPGLAGGSGGGGGNRSTTAFGGSGVNGQGYNGGSTTEDGIEDAGSGGGGAGSAGQSGTNLGKGGNGGTGLPWLNGTYYAGGGGGAGRNPGALVGGTGGNGGGGNGSASSGATAGLANSGSGGGGGGFTESPVFYYNGAAGGSGVVIVRYKG